MKLTLPGSLFISCLVFAVIALPVDSSVIELRQLSSSNFSSLTQQGLWFIEFFSPWCHHCREFAPTWERLVEHVDSQAHPGISLAQVNCIAHGDLCDEQKIRGYPSMKLYRDGKELEEFDDNRDFNTLTKYITKHAHTSPPPTSSVPSSADGTVLSLDKNSFDSTIAEGPTFVKFFAPWCGHCKKLAPTWVQFAAQMKGKLTVAEVNCEVHSRLCSGQEVAGYPTLILYQHGRTVDYSGKRALENLESFVDRVLTPPLKGVSLPDLAPILEKEDVVYLLVHDELRPDLRDRVEEAALPLHGTPPLYSIQSSSELLSALSIPEPQELPVLVVLKDHSMKPFHKLALTEDSSISQLADWLLSHRLPISTELDGENFNRVMGPSPLQAGTTSRFVVLAALDPQNHGHIEIMKKAGTAWNRGPQTSEWRPVVFAWMDRDKWASWLKNVYNIKKGKEPAVVIVDHGHLLYYDVSTTDEPIQLEVPSILSALDGVFNRTIRAKHSENIVERFARWINSCVVGIQSVFLQHPIRSMLFSGIIISAVILGAKRCSGNNARNAAALYTNPKSASRLD